MTLSVKGTMLAKRYRLTKRGSFAYVYRSGRTQYCSNIGLTFVTAKGGVRIGFSVPNKLGKAVVRNKLKRRMRAAAQQLLPGIRPGAQMVFSAKPGAQTLSYAEVYDAMDKLLKRVRS